MKAIEVVAAIIIKDEKILTTKRGYGNYVDFWEFPGGKIEAGESKENALYREIKEELDVKIKIIDFLCTITYEYPEFHLTMHCYLCSVIEGEITLIEHKAAKWLTMDTLNSVQWLPADIQILDYLKKWFSLRGTNIEV